VLFPVFHIAKTTPTSIEEARNKVVIYFVAFLYLTLASRLDIKSKMETSAPTKNPIY
jgi:hypothetical protein